MLSIPHGLHPNIAAADYHVRELGMASNTALDHVRRTPSHYRCWVDGVDEEPTPALELGSAFHCALLEPDVFSMSYVMQPDFGDRRFKENKAAYENWKVGAAGKKTLSPAAWVAVERMVASVHRHPLAARAIADGVPELTGRWRDASTGLECKMRADYYVRQRRMIVDVKSTDDASPEAFRKSVANYGYHRQSALYQDGFAALGERVDHFVFVVVEKSLPHEPAVYTLDADAVSRGRDSIARDMATLAECLRTGEFPGYPNTIQTLSLPAWAA